MKGYNLNILLSNLMVSTQFYRYNDEINNCAYFQKKNARKRIRMRFGFTNGKASKGGEKKIQKALKFRKDGNK